MADEIKTDKAEVKAPAPVKEPEVPVLVAQHSDEQLIAAAEKAAELKELVNTRKPIKAPKVGPQVKIKLIKYHNHAGEMYKTGDVIEVPESILKFIEDNNIGNRV